VEEKEIHGELSAIRNLMERSSKFISLSGLSGILAGVYALIGAGVAYKFIADNKSEINVFAENFRLKKTNIGLFYGGDYSALAEKLFVVALLVLIFSIGTGIFLSIDKAKRKGQKIWGPVSRSLLFHMSIPLISGGVLILILLYRGHYGIVTPCSLIFYGLALVSASNFTFNMVKYLGLCEITLGLIAACLPGYGLLFWALGFGVLHIIYGSMMYLKYDR